MPVLSIAVKTHSFTSYAARELAEIALSYDRWSFVDKLKSAQRANYFEMNPKGFIVC